MIDKHKQEVETGQRFQFGANWSRFLEVLNDERIKMAEDSLKDMLDVCTLEGKTFLDIGSGSGLFSLAAKRLGAQVHSFDYDPQSVACTEELKRRYFPGDFKWVVEDGSILESDYLNSLGQFDVVYSWGVLHHTGDMWQAMENVSPLVKQGGKLFISIYNDQKILTKYWTKIKQIYNRNKVSRLSMIVLHAPYLFFMRWLIRKVKRATNLERGMDLWRDMNDWLGGYPFEVAKPEEVFSFYLARGFELRSLNTCGGRTGCNEFVFKKLKSNKN